MCLALASFSTFFSEEMTCTSGFLLWNTHVLGPRQFFTLFLGGNDLHLWVFADFSFA